MKTQSTNYLELEGTETTTTSGSSPLYILSAEKDAKETENGEEGNKNSKDRKERKETKIEDSDEVRIAIMQSKQVVTIVSGILCYMLMLMTGGDHGIGWFILSLLFIW